MYNLFSKLVYRKDYSMRVIAGKARRRPLVSPEGLQVRPTTDRTKETLFNMIQHDVYGCDFLDLFSGSGAIGIEALSRGAKHAVFVDEHKAALTCIKENLNKTMLIEAADICSMHVIKALEQFKKRQQTFDIIFMDPPYNQGWEGRVIPLIVSYGLLNEGGMIICESAIDTSLAFVDDLSCMILKEKYFKTNKFTFIG